MVPIKYKYSCADCFPLVDAFLIHLQHERLNIYMIRIFKYKLHLPSSRGMDGRL